MGGGTLIRGAPLRTNYTGRGYNFQECMRPISLCVTPLVVLATFNVKRHRNYASALPLRRNGPRAKFRLQQPQQEVHQIPKPELLEGRTGIEPVTEIHLTQNRLI